MAAVIPQDLAQAINYGPKTAQAIRRSQYLADALKQNLESGQAVRGGWGELGARLLAQAILNRASNKAQDATIGAIKADEDAETQKILGGITPAPATAPSSPQAEGLVAQQPEPSASAPIDIGAAPKPANIPAGAMTLTPTDRLALAQAVYGEARGEPATGQQAVASVVLNRARASGKSPAQVVAQPHQFAGYNAGSQNATQAQLAPILANIDPVLSGQAPDPTSGADHFYNPRLASPSWGGPGQDIGHHRFLALHDQGPGPTGGMAPTSVPASAPPPSPPDPNGPAVQPAPQPYQIAANGQTPPPPMSSSPGSSPPVAGSPPAAIPPQAMAAGGSPGQQPRQVANWPTWSPNPQEVAFVESLLRDPRTHQQGVQLGIQMRHKMTQPVEATLQVINGVPVYMGKDPTDGAVMVMPVPREAMSQHLDGARAGLPPGAQMDVSPTGNRSVVYKPPEGYEAAQGGGLQYQQGGPADPTRPQMPASGYQYAGPPEQPGAPARQQAIAGGPADPRSPANLAQGVLSFKKDLDPVVTSAMKVRQNFGAVSTGFQQQNGTGDIAMINGLQKLIDEGVVKGEDVTMQMRSNGLDGTLGGYLQYVNSRGLLTADVRQKVFKTAGELYHNLDQTYQARVMSMRPAVDQIYGQGAFDTYVLPKPMVDQMGWGATGPAQTNNTGPSPAGHYAAGSADAAIAEAVRRGRPLPPKLQQRARAMGLIQ